MDGRHVPADDPVGLQLLQPFGEQRVARWARPPSRMSEKRVDAGQHRTHDQGAPALARAGRRPAGSARRCRLRVRSSCHGGLILGFGRLLDEHRRSPTDIFSNSGILSNYSRLVVCTRPSQGRRPGATRRQQMAQATRDDRGSRASARRGRTRSTQPHSSVEFVARHLLSKARGRFTEFSGEIVVGDGPEDSSADGRDQDRQREHEPADARQPPEERGLLPDRRSTRRSRSAARRCVRPAGTRSSWTAT